MRPRPVRSSPKLPPMVHALGSESVLVASVCAKEGVWRQRTARIRVDKAFMIENVKLVWFEKNHPAG